MREVKRCINCVCVCASILYEIDHISEDDSVFDPRPLPPGDEAMESASKRNVRNKCTIIVVVIRNAEQRKPSR